MEPVRKEPPSHSSFDHDVCGATFTTDLSRAVTVLLAHYGYSERLAIHRQVIVRADVMKLAFEERSSV